MHESDRLSVVDRHALVMAIWVALGVAATILLHFGLGSGGLWAIAAGHACVLAAFAGHVIVNAVYDTTFTRRELALGLVVFSSWLVWLGLAALFVTGFRDNAFAPLTIGLLAIGACVLFYMITQFGVRVVFDAFNVIGNFRTDTANGDRRSGKDGP
jgi:hypothetical protein